MEQSGRHHRASGATMLERLTVDNLLRPTNIPEGFLDGEPASVAFVEAAVKRALSARSLNLGDAQADVGQEALRRLVVSFQKGQFRGESAITTYVYKVAHGAAIDHWRRVRRRREDSGDEHPEVKTRSTPAEQNSAIERSEKRALVGRLLSVLSPSCQKLITRIYFDEIPYGVIARELGKTEDAVKVQAHRCRKEAARLMAEMSFANRLTSGTEATPNLKTMP